MLGIDRLTLGFLPSIVLSHKYSELWLLSICYGLGNRLVPYRVHGRRKFVGNTAEIACFGLAVVGNSLQTPFSDWPKACS